MPSLYSIGVWLGATLITVFFALLLRDSAIIDGVYLPRTNDSLYHARRILDAAVGSRGFYQFDERLHAPDGAWISVAVGLRLSAARSSRKSRCGSRRLCDPAAFISYAPVAWILVNAALFMAICRAIGLSAEMPPARDAVLRAVAADSVAPRDRHDRSPLHRAHVRPRDDLARPALVRASRQHTARRRPGSDVGTRVRVSQRPVHTAARAARCRVRAVAAQRGAAARRLAWLSPSRCSSRRSSFCCRRSHTGA